MIQKLCGGLAAACLLWGCSSLGNDPQKLIAVVEALNDGCDKTVDINLAYVAQMPPSGTVRINKVCAADRRSGVAQSEP